MIALPALNENDQVTLCFLHPNEIGYKILPELEGDAVFTRELANEYIRDAGLSEEIIISLTTSESDK